MLILDTPFSYSDRFAAKYNVGTYLLELSSVGEGEKGQWKIVPTQHERFSDKAINPHSDRRTAVWRTF